MVRVRSVDITISTVSNSQIFCLQNVAFILSFNTNDVSLSKFVAIGVCWNTSVVKLVFNGRPFYDVTSHFCQRALEFSSVNSRLNELSNSAFLMRITGPQHKVEMTAELWR